jgi:pyridoxine/pyridoxamine 5'-phosphate oxidase
VPWILIRSTVTGFAPETASGMIVWTCAKTGHPNVRKVVIAHVQSSCVGFIAALTVRV